VTWRWSVRMANQRLVQGLNWGRGIPADLRSGTSYSRSTTSNNGSCTSQLRSCTFSWDPPLCWVESNTKHYFNAIKAKQIALNARKPLDCALGNPASALGLSGSSFGPSSLSPIRIHHLLLSNLTTSLVYLGACSSC